MDTSKVVLLCVVCVALIHIQDTQGICSGTETPSINMCESGTIDSSQKSIYFDTSSGAPVLSRFECVCALSFSGSGSLAIEHRVDPGQDKATCVNFTISDRDWDCSQETSYSAVHQGSNNITFIKTFVSPGIWASCIKLTSVLQQITSVTCYPDRPYYAPDEVVNGRFGDWSNTSECSVTCGTGTQTWVRRCDSPAPRNNGTECLATNGTRTLVETESRQCSGPACPVNGGWGPWLNTSTCSVTCGSGTRTQTRSCDSPEPQNGGADCLATDGTRVLEESQTVPCTLTACPVNGGWGPWLNASTCSVTCGSGTRTQTRSCDSPEPQNGGADCLATDGTNVLEETQTVPCTLTACPGPVDGGYTDWSSWSTCTKTCGGGTRERSRTCTNPTPENNGQPCAGSSSESEECNSNACPVDGGWSFWSAWGTCSNTCGGGGIKIRTRTCSNPQPENGGAQCIGNSSETESCGKENCPVDGNWSVWSGWDTCSKSCGGGGYQSRYRACNTPTPQYGGLECVGDSFEIQTCGDTVCPINGSWGDWQSWSQCSQTCGSGTQIRYRNCDNPVPQNGGESCRGNYSETKNCYGYNCPVNGQWGEWSSWTTCSVSCATGTYSRYRECNSPLPQNGGLYCDGSNFENATCTNDPCPVNGNWGPWSPWSSCSSSCGNGTLSRTRLCNAPTPKYGGQNCPGSSSEVLTCSTRECPVNGNWGLWSPWSICAITCGSGIISRIRACNSPEPSNGGDKCRGEFTENKSCSKDPCPIDGGVGPWSPWSMCSASCGTGERSRLRYCDNPLPQNRGSNCSDALTQTEVCTITNCSDTGTSQSTQSSQTTPTASPTPTGSQTTPTASSPTPTGSQTTPTASSTTGSTDEAPVTEASRDKEEDKVNIGAIVGGVIGGLLFLLLLILLICCLCRRRRRKKEDEKPSTGPRSVRYVSHGDDVTVTENELYHYDGETPSHATNALFVGGIPETPNSPDYIPHFSTGAGDSYAVIMDSNRSKPKSKERPKLDTLHSQEDKGNTEANGDVRASTDTVKLSDNYNEDHLGRGVENPSYDENYIKPYDSADGETKPKTSTSSAYDYIDTEKLKRDDAEYQNDDLAGDYATLPDDIDNTDAAGTEDSDRYKRFISSEPEESPDDGYLKSPKRDQTFEFPETS